MQHALNVLHHPMPQILFAGVFSPPRPVVSGRSCPPSQATWSASVQSTYIASRSHTILPPTPLWRGRVALAVRLCARALYSPQLAPAAPHGYGPSFSTPPSPLQLRQVSAARPTGLMRSRLGGRCARERPRSRWPAPGRHSSPGRADMAAIWSFPRILSIYQVVCLFIGFVVDTRPA